MNKFSQFDLPVLNLGDDPFERGLIHGRELSAMIRNNVRTYLKRFKAGGLNEGSARDESEKWIEVIKKQNEEYYIEMSGVSEGSDMPLNDIAMLNARYEITFGLFGKEANGDFDSSKVDTTDGCSTFGLLPETTANNHTILGQNWDWLAGIHQNCVIIRINRSRGTNIIFFTEAGILGGKMGVNEYGIGLVENGLVSNHDGINQYEKPFHVRCREILDSDSFDQALRPVIETKRVCSANFVIGHADGEIINIETSPNEASYHYPEDGMITHSNHFTDTRHGPSLMERISTSTLYRANRLNRLLMKHKGNLNEELCQQALADHFGLPNAICRHPDNSLPAAKQTMTNASFVIDLNQRRMAVASGPPCSNSFNSYSIEK